MSGARALASARRRRAEPQTPATGGTTINQSKPVADNVIQSPSKLTPTAMLLSHQRLIENMQKVIENLNNKSIEQSESIHELRTGLTRDSPDDIDFYILKVSNIESQLEEIQKSFLRVQTFAMETNLQSNEINKKVVILCGEDNDDNYRDKSQTDLIKNTNRIADLLFGISNDIKVIKRNKSTSNDHPRYKDEICDSLNDIKNNILEETFMNIGDINGDGGDMEYFRNDGMENDGMENDGIGNDGMENDGIGNDDMENDGIGNDDMENDDIGNDGMENDDIGNDDMENDDIGNDGMENDDIGNDGMENDDIGNDRNMGNYGLDENDIGNDQMEKDGMDNDVIGNNDSFSFV